MVKAIFTNQLALGCAQAAATTVLALLVMLLARTGIVNFLKGLQS